MDTLAPELIADLPAEVASTLTEFVAAARAALGPQLMSVVLYGSAAEGRLRATSDVNLVLVLHAFDSVAMAQLQGPMRLAHAAIRLDAMFICVAELPAAAEAFAVKFDDMQHRHRILWGENPLQGLSVPRAAQLRRLKQVLLNLLLRLRHAHVQSGQRTEQAARAVQDAIGPLRAAAATLEGLANRNHPHPKAALVALVAAHGGEADKALVSSLSQLREGSSPVDDAPPLARVIDLTQWLHKLALEVPE